MANFNDNWRSGGVGKGGYEMQARTTTEVPLILRLLAGQVANGLEVKNALGTTIFSVSPVGNVTYTGSEAVTDSLTVTGATNLLSSLAVTGVSTLTGGLIVSAMSNLNGGLVVTGVSHFNNVLEFNTGAVFTAGNHQIGRNTGDKLQYNVPITQQHVFTVENTVAMSISSTTFAVNNVSVFGGAMTVNGSLTVTGATNLLGGITTSGIRVGAGTAALPSYSFAGDPDTGMYNSSANVLAFATAGGQQATLSAGLLQVNGIQTLSLLTLTLKGLMADAANAVGVSSNTPAYTTLGSKIHSFQNNSAEKAYFTYQGSLFLNKLGTADAGTTVYNSPDYSFQSSAWDTDGSEDTWIFTLRNVPVSAANTTANFKIFSKKNAGAETQILNIDNLGALTSSSSLNSTTGIVQAATTLLIAKGWAPDGAAAVGVALDAGTAFVTAGSKITSFRNAGVEKAFIDKDGIVNGASFQITGSATYGASALVDTVREYGTANGLKLRGQMTDGAAAYGVKIGATNALSTAGAKIAGFFSDSFTTEKAFITCYGGMTLNDGLVINKNTVGSNVSLVHTATTYTTSVGVSNINRAGNLTGINTETIVDLNVAPAFTLTEPGAGSINYFGASIDFSNVAVTAGAGTSVLSCLYLKSGLDPDAGINYALLSDQGVNRFDDWVVKQQNTALASANDLAVTNNSAIVTGAVQINRLASPPPPVATTHSARLTLIFASNPLVKHNQAAGGGFFPILLAGSADYATAANGTLTLQWDCASQVWQEISRKVA